MKAKRDSEPTRERGAEEPPLRVIKGDTTFDDFGLLTPDQQAFVDLLTRQIYGSRFNATIYALVKVEPGEQKTEFNKLDVDSRRLFSEYSYVHRSFGEIIADTGRFIVAANLDRNIDAWELIRNEAFESVEAQILCVLSDAEDTAIDRVKWLIDTFIRRELVERNVDEWHKPRYTGSNMDTAAAKADAARTFSDRELNEYIQWGEVAAAVLRERENKDRAPAESRPEPAAATTRLKWKEDRRPGEGVADFAARAYAAEIGNGSFDKSLIRREDMPLYQRLFRDKAWPELEAVIAARVLTKSQRYTERLREVVARGEEPLRPSRSEDIALYEARRYRVARAKP